MISKLKTIELSFVVLIIIVLSLIMLNNSSITGFVTTDTYTQKLDLTIEDNQLLEIASLNEKPIKITSLKLSGEVIGNGLTEIYLTDNNQKWLVYSNLEKEGDGFSKITGTVVRIFEKEKLTGDVVAMENYETVSGPFKQACEQTCYLENLNQANYYLEVWVQKGAKLRLIDLNYRIEE